MSPGPLAWEPAPHGAGGVRHLGYVRTGVQGRGDGRGGRSVDRQVDRIHQPEPALTGANGGVAKGHKVTGSLDHASAGRATGQDARAGSDRRDVGETLPGRRDAHEDGPARGSGSIQDRRAGHRDRAARQGDVTARFAPGGPQGAVHTDFAFRR
ncbi:MAG: hypothetical protein ACKODL_10325 [Phenylobacterium sp.]